MYVFIYIWTVRYVYGGAVAQRMRDDEKINENQKIAHQPC
jgi:hypothetical protein